MFAVTLAFCFGVPLTAGAETSAADTLAAVRVAGSVTLDRFPGDPLWEPGRVALKPPFFDLATRRTSTLTTTAYVLYDDTNFYVAFHADQGAYPIVGSQTTNNVGFGVDDFVGVGIDPGGTGSQVYYFETTPRGTRYQQASENARFAPQWKASGRVGASGWDAVLIIPLASMRLHAGPQHWRINFIRGIAATGDHLTWSYGALMGDGTTGSGWPNFVDQRFWPTYAGFSLALAQAASHTPRADVYGLASVGHDRNEFEQADQEFIPQKTRNDGIDFAVPVTGTTNFVGTLDPDFSNVEIDQQTISPQEFARQLTEYRPFFAQGAAFLNPNPNPPGGYIEAPNLLFYSPSIGPFDRGAKIEGTQGLNSFGVLSVRGYDPILQEVFDDIAFGYQHALPDRTFAYWTDGVLAHHSVQGSDETVEAGFKGRNLHTGLVYMLNTDVEDGTANGSAHSTNGYIDVHKPNYEVNLGYLDISPYYAPVDGYTSTSDIHGPTLNFNLTGNGVSLKNWFLFMYADRFLDDSGAVHQADTSINLNAAFKNGFSLDGVGLQTGVLRSYAVPAGPHCSGAIVGRSAFDGAPCYLDGETDRFNLATASVGYHDGTPAPIDATYAFGPFGGDELHEFSITTSRPLAGRYALSLEYDGSWELPQQGGGALDSQFLRRIGIERALGADSSVSLSLRSINGTGGFALPGTNVALAYHRHWINGNDLYVNFGTPASTSTLDRVIVKYVLHLGPLPGT